MAIVTSAACTPTAVATASCNLRHLAPMAYTLKELLSMDVEQLENVCDSLDIDMPACKPSQKQSREAVFYHLVSELSSKNLIVDTRALVDQTKLDTAAPDGNSISSDDSSTNNNHVCSTPQKQPFHRDISIQELKILEAIEFTQQVDDGANPDMWPEADLILLGVSRSGKTPLSMFLAAQGYKVANCPLVQGVSVPDQLFGFDQSRVVALVLDPDVLVSIRKKRAAMMGLNERSAAYVNVERIEDELSWVKGMYRQHPQWTLLDVTFRGVEETATKILKAMHQKHPARFAATLSAAPCGHPFPHRTGSVPSLAPQQQRNGSSVPTLAPQPVRTGSVPTLAPKPPRTGSVPTLAPATPHG